MVLKILRKESRKLKRAFVHPTFTYLLLVGNSALVVAIFLVHHFEKDHNPKMQNLFDVLWWGVSTITTVGYGDNTPITLGGRIVGIFLMYIGTIMFVSFTGVLVTRWMKQEVEKEITHIEKEVKKEEADNKQIEILLLDIQDRLTRLEKK